MHEGHFTEDIVKQILTELAQYPDNKVKSVTVRVGEVFHLVPESVLLHYELLTKGSALEGVQLTLVDEPMQVLCHACKHEGPVEDHHLLMCSSCHSWHVVPVSGNRITIEKVELESR